jgi:hypothetical protein
MVAGMTVGDRDPAAARIGAAAAVGWQLGYAYGVEQGFKAAAAAANAAWHPERMSVVEPDPVMFVAGERVKPMTWRERKEARLATLREGHGAGLHPEPVRECPLCLIALGCYGCGHPVAEHGVNGCTQVDVIPVGVRPGDPATMPGQRCPCRRRDDLLLAALHLSRNAQMAGWLERRGVGRTPTPGTVRRGLELDHADALKPLAHGEAGELADDDCLRLEPEMTRADCPAAGSPRCASCVWRPAGDA